MKYMLLLFCSTFYGQILHHQMISSQGESAILSNGILVKQTIGQQSISGTSKGEFLIIQGFQQNYWSKLIANNPVVSNLKISTYPNPFVTEINFVFSMPLKQISITVFDSGGRLVFNESRSIVEGILTIDLSSLPEGLYLVRLNNDEVNYYAKIIKTK